MKPLHAQIVETDENLNMQSPLQGLPLEFVAGVKTGNFDLEVSSTESLASDNYSYDERELRVKFSESSDDLISFDEDLISQNDISDAGIFDMSSPSLAILETLNCRIDLLIKNIAIDHIYKTKPTTTYATTQGLGIVLCEENLVTSKIQQSLYYCIHEAELCEHTAEKLKVPYELLYNTVDWHSLKKSGEEARFKT